MLQWCRYLCQILLDSTPPRTIPSTSLGSNPLVSGMIMIYSYDPHWTSLYMVEWDQCATVRVGGRFMIQGSLRTKADSLVMAVYFSFAIGAYKYV